MGSLLALYGIARADQAADWLAVRTLVSNLNHPALRPALFTAGAGGRGVVERALAVDAAAPVGLAAPAERATVIAVPGTGLEVVISPEPMGEAMLRPIAMGMQSGVAPFAWPGAQTRRVICRSIRFPTADVAVVDAMIVGARSGVAPKLVLIAVRTGQQWRIAVARQAGD